MDRYEILSRIKFFKNFSMEELKKNLLEKSIEISEYEKDDIIMGQGEILDRAMFIVKGTLKGQMLKEKGNVIEIERFGSGTLIAPVFIFAEKNIIPVDLVSVGKSQILSIERESFFNLIMTSHGAMREFLMIASEKTFAISEKMVENTTTIREKLERYMERHRKGDEIKFSVSMKELAEKFSVERPSLSRVIADYIREGRLEKLGRNHYRIVE